VSAERTEQGGNGYSASGYKDVTAPDGRFLLEDLAEGTYVVRARAPEVMPGTVSGVRVVAGRTADAGVIRLGAGGIVRVRAPISRRLPSPSCRITTRLASHARRRDVSAETCVPSSRTDCALHPWSETEKRVTVLRGED